MDLKSHATSTLESAFTVFKKDLVALPPEAFNQKFGDKARTVADIVYEVNLVNDHIGMVIRNEEPFPWPEGGWITAPDNLVTKDAVIDSFIKSSQSIIETAKGFDDNDLTSTVETERGPQTRFARLQFIALHTWYHSGQLNYIQTLIGDDNWHW